MRVDFDFVVVFRRFWLIFCNTDRSDLDVKQYQTTIYNKNLFKVMTEGVKSRDSKLSELRLENTSLKQVQAKQIQARE